MRIVLLGLALILFTTAFSAPTVQLFPAPAPPATPNAGDTKVNPVDGAVMVYVPAGSFIMGSRFDRADEKPEHAVTLDGYWIYRDDVTVAMYRKFCEDTKRPMPLWPSYCWWDNNPMTMVTWFDAVAYAEWAGCALPTEAQWEKAARGTDGRNYPWGGIVTDAKQLDNGWDAKKCACYDNSEGTPCPVGNFPAGNSPYGARDMVGEVQQWCADWYDAGYYAVSPANNPIGPASGTARVLRSADCRCDEENRCAFRDSFAPDDYYKCIGFRCAWTPQAGGADNAQAPVKGSGLGAPVPPLLPTPLPVAVAKMLNPVDGAMMVYIPAGPFLMGSVMGGFSVERPQHSVTLNGYWIDQDDVTVAQFRAFDTITGYGYDWDKNTPYYDWQDDFPMTNVTWEDARAYAAWAGGGLPTEAQWEKAARGADGRNFPWGGTPTLKDMDNGWDKWKCACSSNPNGFGENWYDYIPPDVPNVADMPPIQEPAWLALDDGVPIWRGPSMVGSFPAGNSPYEVHDMAGEVSQWCADWFDVNYYAASPENDPTGPVAGKQRVARGNVGGEGLDSIYCRCAFRNGHDPNVRDDYLGFRCVVAVNAASLATGPYYSPRPVVKPAPLPPFVIAPPPLAQIATKVNPVDGAEMIYIPAGPFLMGTTAATVTATEQPQHTVTLDGYWIYRDDVTVAQFRAFCAAKGYAFPWNARQPNYGWRDDFPMTGVTQKDVDAYVKWAGCALPTEAQWEKAARGTDGRNFPWGGQLLPNDPGNGWDSTKCACWVNSSDARGNWSGPDPVGSFPAGNSPYGVRDMAGEVWQLCADWYDPNYYPVSPAINPTGPATGNEHVIRSGSGFNQSYDLYRCASRYHAFTQYSGGTLGFRCVSSAPGL